MTLEQEARVKMWLDVLQKRLYTPVEIMSFSYFETEAHLTPEQAMAQETWRDIRQGEAWGKEFGYGWFRARLHLGNWADGRRVVMHLNLGGEATLFLNGTVFGSRRADWMPVPHHYDVDNWLEKSEALGETPELLAEVYAGHDRPPEVGEATAGPVAASWHWLHNQAPGRTTLGACTYGIWNEEAYHLYLEAKVLWDLWKNLPAESLRRDDAGQALVKFSKALDFTLEGDAFAENAQAVRQLLQPYLACQNGSTTPHIYAIGHSHLDLAWFWPVEETERKCARTLAAQIRHMDEYPAYKMMQSQPALYEMVRTHYPALFQKLKEKAASGQLIPEGAMWVEPDTNIPSGESLIRQILYGKRYFREEFGVDSRLLWLPDAFGFSAALPQIMKGCGVDYFSTAKVFWAYNGGDPFPYNYFRWKGNDGTEIPSFIIMLNTTCLTDAATLIQRWHDRRPQEGLRSILLPIGYGDGGGGATRDHIEQVLLLGDCEGVPKITFESPCDYFENAAETCPAVPTYVGELYFQAHRGTYTSQAKMKRYNRRSESALRDAEFWSAMALLQSGRPYPTAALEQNWKTLLTNQMHDILPGSAIHRVYARAAAELQGVLTWAEDAANESAAALTTGADGLTVFNALSWARQILVPLPEGWTGCCGGDGVPLKVQDHHALVTVPACGVTSIFPAPAQPADRDCHFTTAVNLLENRWLRVSINARGEIERILDKETGSEWGAGPMNALHLYQDTPSHYEAWDLESIRNEVELPEPAKITVTAAGPIYAELKVERVVNHSTLEQWIRLPRESRQITFRTRIQWKERQKCLKVAFPTNIVTDTLYSEIQYGYLKRPNHRTRQFDADRFEVCNHRWSALLEPSRGCGVLNDSKYGISCEGGTMELTLLRAPIFPDETADQGVQEFTYAFLCWNTPFAQSQIVQQAYALNTRVLTAPGSMPTGSFLTVSDPQVVIDCVKKAERPEGGLVVRAYECTGSRRTAAIAPAGTFVACQLTNMLEEPQAQLPMQDGAVTLQFEPFEVKTLIFS